MNKQKARNDDSQWKNQIKIDGLNHDLGHMPHCCLLYRKR